MKTFLAVVLLCATGARVWGGILLSDSFTYPNGVVTNVSAGKWRHASGGFAEVNVEGERVELTGAESEDVEASLSVSYSSISGANLFAKFSVTVLTPPTDVDGGYFASFAGGSGRARVFAVKGVKAGTFRLALANGSSTASSVWPVDLLANQPYTVMTRLVVSNAQAALWVNPISQTSTSMMATDVVAAATASVFRWRQDSEIGTLAVDDLVVATSFEEALLGNQSPVISGLSDRNVASGASTAPIPFVIGDAETSAEALTVSAQAADNNLVQSISFAGTDSNRTMVVTALPNRSGTTPITVFVTDGTTTNSGSFMLTVFPALIFSEDFLYADGPLIETAAPTWVHHGGTNFGEVQVVGERVVLSVPQTEDVSATLPYGPFAVNSGLILYASFRVNFSQRPGTSGDYVAHFNATGARCRVFANTLNAGPGKFRLGLANGASDMSQQFAVDLATNTNHLVVVRYDPATALSTFWVNPTNENFGTNATDLASANTISTFAFRQSASIGTFTIDDLRVGLSFAAVMGAEPCLRIEKVDEVNVRLAWPAGASGFILQSRSDLNAEWLDALATPVVVGREIVVTNSPVESPVFYRLRR
jgi:hypothetical protein